MPPSLLGLALHFFIAFVMALVYVKRQPAPARAHRRGRC